MNKKEMTPEEIRKYFREEAQRLYDEKPSPLSRIIFGAVVISLFVVIFFSIAATFEFLASWKIH